VTLFSVVEYVFVLLHDMRVERCATAHGQSVLLVWALILSVFTLFLVEL